MFIHERSVMEGTKEIEVPVELGRGASVPVKAHEADAGFDLVFVTEHPQGVILRPGDISCLPTEIHVGIPEGVAGLVCPRSGLAANHGVTVINAPGVIDPGYTGEVLVPLVNLGGKPVHIRPGDRIAQLVFVQLAPVVLFEPDGPESPTGQVFDEDIAAEFGPARGDGGFGSTGA